MTDPGHDTHSGGGPAEPGRPPAATPASRAVAGNGRKGLEAPHRRAETGSRLIERTAVRAYRGTAWLMSHTPPGPPATVIGLFSQASYLAWPKRRHWIDRNFGHVLGRDPGSRSVRRLALRAYNHYARYLVEVMRLPSLSAGGDRRARRAGGPGRPRADLARIGRGDPGRRPRRQQRGLRGRRRLARLADQRRRRRLVLPRDVRAVPPAPRVLRRRGHPVAQPAQGLRGPPAQGAPRAPRRLGLPLRRDPRSPVRRLDGAARRTGQPGREDRRHDPAGRHPAHGVRALPGGVRHADPGARQLAGRAPGGDPADGRLAPADDRRGPRAVVQLQADVARDRRGGERARRPGRRDAGRHRLRGRADRPRRASHKVRPRSAGGSAAAGSGAPVAGRDKTTDAEAVPG